MVKRVDEKEFNNVYTIPANYTDSGKLLGGMLETRNTIEAGLLLALIGYPEFAWLPVAALPKIVVMTVTLLPTVILALMGVGGDSLGEYLHHMVKFRLNKRKLHMRRIKRGKKKRH
jgi:hypothetical protein